MNIDEITTPTQNIDTLDEKLKCAFATIGVQIGDLLRCMIKQEIASNMDRVTQLNNILNGSVCDTTQTPN